MTKSIWWKTIGVFICLNGMFLILALRPREVPGDKYDHTLHAIGKMLAIQHYAPKTVDDSLSSKIFIDYLNKMDGEKIIFTNQDLKSFNDYKFKLDDEINGDQVDFFHVVVDKYKNDIGELIKDLPAWFSKPFVFATDNSDIYISNNLFYAATAEERSGRWKTKIRNTVLERYVDAKEARDQSKIDSIKSKTDDQVLKEVTDQVKSQMEKMLEQYNTQNTEDDFFSIYANSFVNLFDPHSDYFLPVEKRTWNEKLSGKFYGIGAQIGEENGFLKLVAISVGGPAWKSGEVDAGDLVLKVGQGDERPIDIAGFSVTDGVKLIRGDNKTIVSLTLKKLDGTIKVVRLVRDELKIEETFARSNILKYDGKKIGVINLPKFYTSFGEKDGRSCSEDMQKELERLKADTIDGVIIDLRGNGGGSLQEVVDMVGLFIPTGPVVQVKGKTGRPGLYLDRDAKVVYDGPLMVMVNEFSASASEIFAAAIQDYKRGTIIGSGTYGKGTVQRPYDLNVLDKEDHTYDLGNIHITMQKYYRINGSSVQLKGVVPDIRLNGYYENYKVKERDQESALDWDELGKQEYATWISPPELPTMLDYFETHIDTGGVFTTFDENSKWLASQMDKPRIISENAYKEQVKTIREKSAFNRDMLRLSTDLDVYGVFDGNTEDKIKIDRNNRITNFYKKDRYLQISAELMSKWISKASFSSN